MRDGTIMFRFGSAHRTNNCQLIHQHCGLRPEVSELDACDICRNRPGRPLVRRSNLWIECVELAGPAIHPQQDHRLALFAQFISLSDEHITPAKRQDSRCRRSTELDQKIAATCHSVSIDGKIQKRSCHRHTFVLDQIQFEYCVSRAS